MNPRAVVIGAGPAGLSAALGLLRYGVAVTLRDRSLRPPDRVCGSFLSPEAWRHIAWLGLTEQALGMGASPVQSARITSWFGLDRTIPLDPPGWALPRKTLEDLLLRELRRLGGRVEWGAAAPLPSAPNPARPEPLIIAAGKFGGNPPPKGGQGWYGWNAAFSGTRQNPSGLSVHFHPGGYAGIQTFSDGTANVCGLLYKNGSAEWGSVFQASMETMPAFRALMAGARRLSPWLGTGPLPFGRRRQSSIAVGDAAAVGDPFFGEGIGRALAAGPMLYRAWTEDDPAAAHRRIWQRAFARRIRAGGALRRLMRRPALLRATLLCFARPSFARILSHMGAPARESP